ncbi:MFS family permease [Breznakia sp. PF5-3]|uniref:putative ABC exporter domain-containing protein n=1 Tax=unclassified Breznakia TaxID=2623764 RepID=UPI002404EC18|nr:MULTISPECIES: putative ABC exporter domain-containing protein [unclassified Breznakia]MDF9825051.1 MFS family permease [Breznakia sp. PM6-1]MDF9835898.1 MFS family permease [Breznakia sp. PF5-3]MDF9837359.1 MFS family permease [Breznakia sp. PFB2-8]MDF9859294.1 MFS family permease [Breznakia sp. PH5-24]
MNALQKLWFHKQWGTIRNLFRKPSSTIATLVMVAIYGGLLLMVLIGPKLPINTMTMKDLHTAVLISIGFSGIIILSTLFQKRKALFYADDAFYLFSGPFSDKQIMRYLMSQTIMQSILMSLLSLAMMLFFVTDLDYSIMFLFLTWIGNFLMYFFFFVFSDYLYLLSITNEKYKKSSYIIAGVFIGIILLVFIINLAQNQFDVQNGLMSFAESNLFYFVPIFGWVKMILISYIEQQYLFVGLGFGLLLLAIAILYAIFTRFKGDYKEQALEDAQELTDYVKEVRAGKQDKTMDTRKVKNVRGTFRKGAWALFSKEMLQMRKSGAFISKQDIFILIFYFVITLFTDLGFPMFCYMLVIWLFTSLQNSSLSKELKNYQVYLIPANPLAKLIALILPMLLRVSIIICIAIIASGLYFSMEITEIFQYLVMLLGYSMVFISATVLSIKILRSRSNAVFVNLMRMLIILLCAAPGIGLTFLLIFHFGYYDMFVLQILSYSSLVLNFVISFIIILLCKNMMNGRELQSD